MAQFARPDSTVSAGGWVSSGSTLWDVLDEASPSDVDSITTAWASGAQSLTTTELGLSNVNDPVSSTGHVLRFRLSQADSSAVVNYVIALYQGATQIVSFSIPDAGTSGGWTSYAQSLSGAQADAITDYTDLRVRVSGERISGGRQALVSWVELEVPTPIIDITQYLAEVDIAVEGYAPDLTVEAIAAPPNFTIEALPATLIVTSYITVDVDVADLTVAGVVPGFSVGDITTQTTESADISVVGLAPEVLQGVAVDVADISIQGQSPTVEAIKQVQILRPDGDVLITGMWGRSPTSGTWFSHIDEVIPNDDVDYIWYKYSGNFYQPYADYFDYVLSLSDIVGDPVLHTGHVLRVRYMHAGGNPPQVRPLLYQGSTFIGEIGAGSGLPVSSSWTTISLPISTDALKWVTDYNDLRLVFRAAPGVGQASGETRISWVEVEIPEPSDGRHAQLDPDTPQAVNVAVAGVAPGFTGFAVEAAGVVAPTGAVTIEAFPPSVSDGNVTTIAVTGADIQIAAPSPDAFTPGSPNLGVDPADITVAGSETSLTVDRTFAFEAEVVDVVVLSPNPTVRTGPDSISFRFIAEDYNGLTTFDADPLTQLGFGPLLHGQMKHLRFRVGNESTATTHFTISAVSENPGVASMVLFSTDNVLYTPSITIGSVPGNGVTDVVWVKMTTTADARLGAGNFLIEVEQTVA